MASNKGNIVMKLLLEDKEFQQQLGLSKKEISGFSSNVSSALGVVGKLATALGAGATAYEVFNKAVHSSQASADAWENAISAAKSTVDRFFTSLTTGDWTPFMNGLQSTINKALEAARAMDQLGNTKMSYSFASAEANANIQEAMTILSDPNSTKEQIADARKLLADSLADLNDMVGTYATDAMNVIKTRLSADTGLAAGAITDDIVKKFFMLDAKGNREKIKSELDGQLNEYDKLYNQAVARHTTQRTTKGQYGNNIVTNQVDWNAVAREMEPYMYQNSEALIYRAILNNWDDKTLQEQMNIMQGVFNERRSIASTERRAGKYTGLGTPSVTSATTKDVSTPVGTINVLNAAIDELRKKISSATDPILMTTLNAELTKTEKKLAMIKEGMGITWEKGGEIAAPGYTAPTALNGFTAEMGGELSEYSDGIDDLTTALDGMFSVMRNGEPDFKSFLSMMGTLIGGAIGGAGGASIGGTIANGIGNLLAKDMSSTPTVTVRGSDLQIALNNYNKRMN